MIHALLVGVLLAGALQEPAPVQEPGTQGNPQEPEQPPVESPAPEADRAGEGAPPVEPEAQTPEPAADAGQAEPPAPPANGAGAGSDGPLARALPLNGVRLIVNEKCITSSDVLRRALRQRGNVSTEEELQRLLGEIAGDLTKRQLMEQAGRDLGYEEGMVRALVRERMEERKENAGSVTELARQLELLDIDSSVLKEDIEDRVYRELWEGSVSGKFAGPGGRPYVDRFVRPGLLRFEFLRQGARPDLPATVRLEELLIAPGRGETLESARQRATLVRSRVERGEDFAELNAQFGLPDRGVELPPIEETKLALLPDLKAFVDGAAEGDVSEVLPVQVQGQTAGFRIVRFVGREEARVLDFVDREFQARLTTQIQTQRDTYRQQRALRRLLDAAYIWPPEAVGREADGGATPSELAAGGG